MENYFDFYKIEEKFFIDEADLRQKYLELSKAQHPDFFVDNAAQYQAALEITSINNKAYKTLGKFETRLAYILEINQMLLESKNSIPQSFLMEMMEVNEAIMDIKMEPNAASVAKIGAEVAELAQKLNEELQELAQSADKTNNLEQRGIVLERLKENYLKLKYVLRIKESLNTFVA